MAPDTMITTPASTAPAAPADGTRAPSGPGTPPGTGWADDAGMATAEYAIATLAACGFAGLLLVILRSDEVRTTLLGLITRALSLA